MQARKATTDCHGKVSIQYNTLEIMLKSENEQQLRSIPKLRIIVIILKCDAYDGAF
jgi:hypothetical protein